MTNKEKYAQEILDITCNGGTIAVKKSGGVMECSSLSCSKCLFKENTYRCSRNKISKWCKLEYTEKPILTSIEKLFLNLIQEKYRYIARNEDGALYVYSMKPNKESTYWSLFSNDSDNTKKLYIDIFNVNFDFIKWEDEKPWEIEELKNLDVM